MSPRGHVWTAPWQELSDILQHWSGAVMCPACLCSCEAAGPNAVRGSGPNQKHAFKDAMTQTGSPDPRYDRICITSSCPRQFLKRQLPIMALPPCLASTQPRYSTSMPRSGGAVHIIKNGNTQRVDVVRFTPQSGHATDALSWCRHNADGQNGGLRTCNAQSSCLSTTWSTLYGPHTDIELVRELPARGAEVFFAAAPMPAAGKRSEN